MVICSICGEAIEPKNLEKHLLENHRLTWQDYFEMLKIAPPVESINCWNCGTRRSLLTPWIRSSMFLLPCIKCDGQSRKNNILSLLEKYCLKILTDKYYQDIIVNPDWLHYHLNHSLVSLKEYLKSKQFKYSKHSRFYIDFNPWTIKEISDRNNSDIKITMKNRELECSKLSNKEYSLTLGNKDYVIELPEDTIFDVYHHTRYSIFNMKDYSRKSKRLKFQDQSCIKLYEPVNGLSGIKSILRLKNDRGVYVDPRSLSEENQKSLMLIILRTSTIRELLIKIYLEISRYSSYLNDYAFISNKIILSNNPKEPGFIFSWFARNEYVENTINLCII